MVLCASSNEARLGVVRNEQFENTLPRLPPMIRFINSVDVISVKIVDGI